MPAPAAIPANALFGRQTRFAGELRVVSAPFDDEAGFLNSGKVYVYDDLTLIATLQPQVLASLLDFGLALGARPGLVAVGNPRFDLPESADAGQVELFDVDPNSPDFGQRVLVLRPEIEGSLVSPGAQFGFGVAFDGDHLLVSEGLGGDLWVFRITEASPPTAQLLARFEDLAAPLPNPGIGAGIDAADGRVLVGSSQEQRPDGNGQGRAHYLVYDPADPLFGFSASVNAPVATPNGQNYGESVLLLSDGRFAVGARGFEVDLQPQAGAVFIYNGEPGDLRVELCELEIDSLTSTATATIIVPGLAPIDVPLQASGQMQSRLYQSDAALHTVHFTDGQIALDDLNGGPLNLNLQDVLATLTAPGLPARVEADGSFLQRNNGVEFSGTVSATVLGIPLTQNLADLTDTVDFTGQVLDATPGMPILQVPLQIIIPVDLPGPNGSVLINGTLVLRKAQPADELFADSFDG